MGFKKILFLILTISAISTPHFAFGIEISYPSIPGFPAITDTSGLPAYISYWFTLLIMAGAILAAIYLVIGGIRVIASVGNAASQKEGADTIKGAVLGLILLVAAYMILRTINLALITPNLTPLPPSDGIFYIKGQDRQPAPMSETNTSNVPSGYSQILYACGSGPAIYIWKFPKKDFQGTNNNYRGAYVVRKTCGQTENLSGVGSFKIEFETPGIYYCAGVCNGDGTICSGYMSQVNTASGQIPEPFKDNSIFKSVLFVNDLGSGTHYGAIFHDTQDPSDSGTCSRIYNLTSTATARICEDIGQSPVTSITIFAWNYQHPETSGAGAWFYSEPWGASVGARSGVYLLSQPHISNFFSDNASSLGFDYTNNTRPTGYMSKYPDFSRHPGSVYLKGNYLLSLNTGLGPTYSCQVFTSNIYNMHETQFEALGNTVNNVQVIPIK